MSIISCHLERGGRSGKTNARGQKEYDVTFRVTTNHNLNGQFAVQIGATGVGPNPLPVRGSIYNFGGGEADFASFCQEYTIKEGRTPREWYVTAHFRPLEPNQQQQDFQDNPMLRPTKFRLEQETFTELTNKDKDGNAIKNSAGVVFSDGVERESSRPVLVIERNYATLQEIINLNISFSQRTNSTTYLGGAARTWLCRAIASGDQQSENGFNYYRAAIHLVYNDQTWDVAIVDEGAEELVAGELTNIKDKNGDDVAERVPLDGAGAKLAEGDPLVFITKRIYKEANFGSLPT